MEPLISALLLAVWAGATTLLLTPPVRRAALRFRVLDAPGGRKVHVRPVPYLGGVAVVASVLVWIVGALAAGDVAVMGALTRPWIVPVAAGFAASMLLGLGDDLRGLSPRARLAGEMLIIGAVLAATGVPDVLRVGGIEIGALPQPAAYLVAGFWVLALTNAGNLLDGMDGLAAGVGAIAAGVLAFLAASAFGRPEVASFLGLVAGAYAGFLAYNRHPARIYLGDAGSLALGYALGMGSLFATTDASGAWHVAPALLVLGIPATDLLLAVLRRGLSSVRIDFFPGAPDRFVFRVLHAPRFFQADRGHLHHRLFERTRSVPRTVLLLQVVGVLLGGLGIWAAREPASAPMLLVGSVLLGLMAASRFLHPELRVFEKGFLLPLFHTRKLGNRRLHFAYDAAVFGVSFAVAGWIGSRWWPGSWPDLGRVGLAALSGPTLMALLGLYRIHLRRAGVWSVWKAASSIAAGAAGVLVIDTVVAAPPLASASGVLFVYLALTGSLLPRAGYGLMDEAFQRRPTEGRSTLIYGTGTAEVALLHRLLERPELDLRPIGFVDEAPEIEGKMIQGLPAYRARETEVAGLLRSLGVDVVIVAGTGDDQLPDVPLYVAVRAAGARLVQYRESLEEVPIRGVERGPDVRRAPEPLRHDPHGRRSEAG